MNNEQIRTREKAMRSSISVGIAVMSVALFASGCDKNESPVDNAIENTKDALNIRENEKLKDAGEHLTDAVDDAAAGIEDAVNDK